MEVDKDAAKEDVSESTSYCLYDSSGQAIHVVKLILNDCDNFVEIGGVNVSSDMNTNIIALESSDDEQEREITRIPVRLSNIPRAHCYCCQSPPLPTIQRNPPRLSSKEPPNLVIDLLDSDDDSPNTNKNSSKLPPINVDDNDEDVLVDCHEPTKSSIEISDVSSLDEVAWHPRIFQMEDDHSSTVSPMEDDSFVLDKSPCCELEVQVPRYGVSRKSTELKKVEEQIAQRTRPQHVNHNPCWNCGKPLHAIRDCPAESSSIAVEWNRELRMLMKELNGFRKNAGRYHENEKASKYAHLTPGTISPELRKIMGLSENDLPPYIYRLRKHGYPRAWLRYSSIKPSGLNVYDAHGNEEADPDAEDGEILEEEDKIRYDLTKLIKFPGFNAPAPENTVDDYLKMNALAYSESHSLELMINDLQEKAVTEYRLKKEKKETKKSIVSNGNEVSEGTTSDADQITSSEPSSNKRDVHLLLEEDSGYCPASQDTYQASQSIAESLSGDVSTTSIPAAEESLGRVLTVTPGTPILKTQCKHSRLPPAENFSKDICDVINFENLPESTGKFEKMRSLLKTVKKVLGLQQKR